MSQKSTCRVAADGTISNRKGGIYDCFREAAGIYWVIFNPGAGPSINEHFISVTPVFPDGLATANVNVVGNPPPGANAPTGAKAVRIRTSAGGDGEQDVAFLFKVERN